MPLNICNEQDSPRNKEIFSPKCQVAPRLRNPGREEHKMIGILQGSSNESLSTDITINVVGKHAME